MACKECERLSRAEIEATRRAVAAEIQLQSFYPEPPFGETAANQLKSFQRAFEESRATVDEARTERVAHMQTHAMTILS